MARLPKSTLLAVRLPHVEKLRAAFDRTFLSSLVNSPEFADQGERVRALYSRFGAELSRGLPDIEALQKEILALEGEAVLALVSFDLRALSDGGASSGEFPATCALMFDAGNHAYEFDSVLQRGFAILEASQASDPGTFASIERVAVSTNGWHLRLRLDGVILDFSRDESQFLMLLAPEGASDAHETPLAVRSLDDSFLSSEIVRAAPDSVRDGAVPVVEMYLNLEPVWNAVELVASGPVKKVLVRSGCSAIRGLAASAAMGGAGIDESLLVLVPGGKDLLTRTLTHRPLDPVLAHYIPTNAQTASIATFDVAALYEGVTKLLAEPERVGLEKLRAGLKKDGVDLRKDLIDNIGPTFGFSGTLDSLSALHDGDGTTQVVDATLLVQIADAARFRASCDALVARSGLDDHVHAKDIHGFTTYSLDALPLPGPDGRTTGMIEPHWFIGEDVFMLSLSRAGLARALAAGWDESNRGPAAMKAALEQDANRAFSILAITPGDGSVASTTIGRRTGLGLEVSTREGPGLVTSYSLVLGASLTASILIPKLMAARIEANERSALQTLRAIADAEVSFRSAAHVDQDGDGAGEFGTLAELTGTATLRGRRSALATPLFAPGMKLEKDGLLERSGYMFRIELCNRLTRVIEFDEREFTVLAWPVQTGATGRRVFVIDAEAQVEASDNRGDRQRYSGAGRAPAADAAKSARGGKPLAANAGHYGRDGGVWCELD